MEKNEYFDEYLDGAYPEVKIADLTFQPSKILFECDPVAYRIYSQDFTDSLQGAHNE